MDNIEIPVQKELILNDDALDLVSDVLENRLGIEALDKVPIVSYAVKFLKIKDAFREWMLLRRIAVFVKNVSQKLNSEEDRLRAVNHLYSDKKTFSEELRYLLIILEKYLEEEKARWLALVYSEYIWNNVNLTEFKMYAEIIYRFLPGDIESLRNGEKEFKIFSEIPDSMLRLESMGLMQKVLKIICDAKDIASSSFENGLSIPSYENGSVFKYTKLGLKLRSILFPALSPDEGLVQIEMKNSVTMI